MFSIEKSSYRKGDQKLVSYSAVRYIYNSVPTKIDEARCNLALSIVQFFVKS